MHSRALAALLGTALLLAPALGTAEATDPRTLYFIDPSHSSIEFSVPFMGIARVTGRFNQFYGRVLADLERLESSSVRVVIRAASIDTRNDHRDADLRGADYFDVERFPELVFEAEGVEVVGDRPVLRGRLRMHGVEKECAIPFEILGRADMRDGHELGVAATLVLDRTEFGLTQGQFSGDRMFVGTEVTIELFLRLREVSSEKAEMMRAEPAVEIGREELDRFAGIYATGEADGRFELEVLVLDGELALVRGSTLYRLVPTSAATFRLDDRAARIRFEGAGPGASSLVWEQPGREPVTYRLR